MVLTVLLYGLRLSVQTLLLTPLLILPRKLPRKLSKKQEEILAFLKNNPMASRKDLTDNITDLTEDGIKYNLKRLKELELIRRVGPDKGGFWEVIE